MDGVTYRIAAPGNPALNDPHAATMSITAQDGTKTYLYDRLPSDGPLPGDEPGDEPGDYAAG